MPTPIERCFAEVPRDGRVLDVGCLGLRQVANARAALRADLRHAGVDRLPPPAELPEGFEYRVADLDTEPLPFPDDSFDLVVVSHVIEHLRRPMEAAAEWVRVCKPGGRIYIEAPSERSLLLPGMPWAHDEFYSLSFFDDPTHVGRPWTPQALSRLARYFGCEPEEARHLSSWRARLLFPYYFLGSIARRRPDIFEWAVWAAVGWASCLVMRKPHHLSGGPVAIYTSSGRGHRLGEPNDARYQTGWFTTWNLLKRRVIADVLSRVPLRASGCVLDFGCGTGELTRELVARYPSATVEGTDISSTALDLARRNCPEAQFWTLTPATTESRKGRYDLLFTHHVLEHVEDLPATAATMSSLCAENARMVHVMPCGVPGSLEWRIATTFVDGVQADRGGRFIHEDPGHVRRMQPDEVGALFEPHGFRLVSVSQRNHFWGTVEWASQNPLTAAWIANPLAHRSADPVRGLAYTVLLVAGFLLRSPVLMLEKVVEKARRQFWYRTQRLASWKWALLLAAVPLSVLFSPVGLLADRWLRTRALREWEQRPDAPGAEMFLILERSGEDRGASAARE